MECAIYLGQGRKRELLLRSPLLAASGVLGYLPERPAPGLWGAWVTPPLTQRPRRGAEMPLLAHTTAGYVLHTGRRNPGLRAALARHGDAWRRLSVPTIAALYGGGPDELGWLAAEATAHEQIAGLEVHLPHALSPREFGRCVAAACDAASVPCLACLPFENTSEAAVASEEVGADALVISAPPLARALTDGAQWVYGPLHSPALLPLTAERVHQAAQVTSRPIIARGGIATADDALALVHAGACAVQIDSICYVQPEVPADILAGLERALRESGHDRWQDQAPRCTRRPQDDDWPWDDVPLTGDDHAR